MNADQDWVRCSCCGEDIPDDDEHNTDHGEVPNPHDVGFGMCVDCGGDKRVAPEPGKKLSDAQVKRKLGWSGRMFYEARFDILEKNLTGANLEKFRAMSYAKKMLIVAEKGHMI